SHLSIGGIPYPSIMISRDIKPWSRDNVISVGAERRTIAPKLMGADSNELFSACGFPNPGGAVGGGRHDALAVGAELYAGDFCQIATQIGYLRLFRSVKNAHRI